MPLPAPLKLKRLCAKRVSSMTELKPSRRNLTGPLPPGTLN
jgi:hypothetical protein